MKGVDAESLKAQGSDDVEIEAMQNIYDALTPFSEDAQKRILDYVVDRFSNAEARIIWPKQ